jgi:Mrp family chromosome partitioning ATPase
VRRPDELEQALDLPVLASVPTSRALSKGAGLSGGLSGGEAEAFRLLRENLHQRRDGDRETRCLLITSAAPGSGKTTIALHLAAAAAAGTVGDVLLIEADLRRPRLSKLLDLPTDRGLSTLLQSDETLEDVIVHVPTAGTDEGRAEDGEFFPGSFDVLGAGPPHSRASELLRSRRMRGVIDTAMREYGLVVIDGPPPGFVSDAIPLMEQSDGVIVVARVGHERGPELRRLRTELARHGVEPLGVVANFTRPVKNPYAFSGR